jgi:hypothetical protein
MRLPVLLSKPAPLPPFTFEAETTAFTARFSTPPTAARKYTLNRFIKRLKDGGVFTRLYHGWILAAADAQSSLLDLVGTSDATLTGAPTFAANVGYTPVASAGINTNWNPVTASVDITDFSLSFYSESAVSNAASDVGQFITPNGITANANTDGTHLTARLNGALYTSGSHSTDNDGSGMHTFSVVGNVISLFRNGVLLESAAYTPAAAVSLPLYLAALDNNGTLTAGGRQISFACVGKSMSLAQHKLLYTAFQAARSYINSGDLNINEAGYAPQAVTADVIVYGATPSGALAAYEAMRQGRTVALVGGWRDRHVTGMPGGGLGNTDLNQLSSLGGLPRLLLTKINSIYSRADTSFTFEPRVFERALHSLLDGARTGGLNVPIYWSTGVTKVRKRGATILSFDTQDGRTFTGKQFIDASYEGDLMFRAGVTAIIGREAAGSGSEAYNGYRANSTGTNGSNHQFGLGGAGGYNIDPYRTAGVSGSGLLNNLDADPGKSAGVADRELQSYSFRPTLSNSAKMRDAIIAKPTGYNIADYEALLRDLATLATNSKVDPTHFSTTTGDFWKISTLVTNIVDANNGGGQSLDWIGHSRNYIEADYTTREIIWQGHVSYTQGFLYTLNKGNSGEGDSRVPTAVESDWQAFQYDRQSYCDNHPNDAVWWPYQLYIRESRRMVSDYIHNGNDITATDGTIPRSVKTVAVASYTADSHHTQRFADLSGTPRVWNTGNFDDTTAGGTDQLSPLPYEIIIPKAGEANNLLVTYCVSATHAAFGSIRMEFPIMTLGQAAGLAAAIAIENSQTVQNVVYSTLRTRLLASNTLSGEVAPVLPQVN